MQAPIEDVRERVSDFTSALRQAGAEDIARRIDAYAHGFVDGTQVRRSVDAIRQQLRYFRAYPEELPDLPVIQIAANRLEDACKEVLRAGLIAPAKLTLREQTKRKLLVVAGTLLVALVVALIPLAVALAGVDVEDLWHGRKLPEVALEQGGQLTLQVNVLEPTGDPRATTGAVFSVAGDCPAELARGASCRSAGRRAFGSVELPAFEILQADQAYGMYVAFGASRLIGAVVSGEVLVSASNDTPEGSYTVPLAAAFEGYAPARCPWYLSLVSKCTAAQRGPHVRSEVLPAPALQVRVTRPRHTPAELSAAQKRAEEQRAEQRAAELTAAIQGIAAKLSVLDAALRQQRWDEARLRSRELAQSFEPLDALAVQQAEGEALPTNVAALRVRFDAQQRALDAFHERAFDTAYAALNAAKDKGQDERILTRVAAQLGITREHLDQIYAEHAQQVELRLQRAAAAKQQSDQAALAALLRRCGPLPKNAWRDVQTYLTEQHKRSQLNECFTPRLSAKTCWSVVCDFDETTPDAHALLDSKKNHKWTFRLQGDRVTAHLEHVDESGDALQP